MPSRRPPPTIAVALLGVLLTAAEAWSAESFSPYVDSEGTISLPEGFRHWTHLGTWSIAGDGPDTGAKALHGVYSQPETVAAYRETGQFPDGAVLVKELINTVTEERSTGRVSRATGVTGWFVMIKDSKGRFPDHPLWGDGWGWALFGVEAPGTQLIDSYLEECLPCHVPVRASDWVFVDGYPVLQKEDSDAASQD